MSGYGIEINRISGLGTGQGIDRVREISNSPRENVADTSGEKSFGNMLKNLVDEVKQSQETANHATEELAAGRKKDLHGAMLAMEQADISLRMLVQVRNKVIDAYREIMRMQV